MRSARAKDKLTDVAVRNASPKTSIYRLADGGGLYLEVHPSGARYWRLKYRLAGKEKRLAIGVYPAVKLAAARAERDKWKLVIESGHDPVLARALQRRAVQKAEADTFQSVAEAWIDEHRTVWTPYYLKQVESYLRKDVYAHIGKLPVRDLTRDHVRAVVDRISKRLPKGAAAINVRQWIRAVLHYAREQRLIREVPSLDIKVKRKPKEHAKNHDRAAIDLFRSRLQTFGGNRSTAIALELLLLLFVRTIELRQAEWSEFDLDAAEPMWRIPAGKMKRGREHWVPLPKQAATLLRELREITGSGRYLFPNTRRPRDCMSKTTVNRALEYMGYASGEFSGHDFRATAATLLRESLGFNGEWIEVQLAHGPRNEVEGAYNHARYLDSRRTMLQRWADWIEEPTAKESENVHKLRHITA